MGERGNQNHVVRRRGFLKGLGGLTAGGAMAMVGGNSASASALRTAARHSKVRATLVREEDTRHLDLPPAGCQIKCYKQSCDSRTCQNPDKPELYYCEGTASCEGTEFFLCSGRANCGDFCYQTAQCSRSA